MKKEEDKITTIVLHPQVGRKGALAYERKSI
jgi:hypothetical protein